MIDVLRARGLEPAYADERRGWAVAGLARSTP
jgi:hypothetical protein